MDLDHRARRAAQDLHRSVTDLDLGAVHAEVVREGARRRHRARRSRAALLGAGAVFLVGAFAVVALVGRDGGGPGRAGDGPERVATELPGEGSAADAGYASQVFDAMPSEAMDGKSSWRLPVLAQPQHDLEDGDTITLFGRGFEPDESIGVVHCTAEADVGNAGINACQLSGEDGSTFGAVQYANADADGNVVAVVTVHRYVTTPDGGTVDCASAAERCLIGMGAISNYDRSGGSYIDFADAPDFPEPSMAISPEGPVVPGEPVTVALRDLVPHRPIRLSQCLGDRCAPLADVKADERGAVDQVVTLQPSFADPLDGEVLVCEDRCTLRGAGIGPTPVLDAMASHAPLPDDVPLTFTSDVPAPTEPQATTTTVAPTTTTAVEPADDGPTATTATTAPDPAPEVPTSDGPDTVPGGSVEATTIPGGSSTPTTAGG